MCFIFKIQEDGSTPRKYMLYSHVPVDCISFRLPIVLFCGNCTSLYNVENKYCIVKHCFSSMSGVVCMYVCRCVGESMHTPTCISYTFININKN